MTPPLRPCGTIGAARRHERAGEPKCEPCREAWAEHQAEQYLKRKAAKAKAKRAAARRNTTKTTATKGKNR